jgi:hypothetical protein
MQSAEVSTRGAYRSIGSRSLMRDAISMQSYRSMGSRSLMRDAISMQSACNQHAIVPKHGQPVADHLGELLALLRGEKVHLMRGTIR